MKGKRLLKKILRLKYIVALLIVIVVGIVALNYFVGGIKATTLKTNNKEFVIEGFLDFTSYSDDDGNTWYDINEEDVVFEEDKIVGKTEKFTMFFSEKTTVATVVVNDSLISGENPNTPSSYTIKYTTAATDVLGNRTANLNAGYFYADNNLEGSPLNSYNYSVAFANELTGQLEKHYQIKYLTTSSNGDEIDGVQILYTIGKFSAGRSYFPTRIYNTLYKPSKEAFTDDEYTDAYNDYLNQFTDVIPNVDDYYDAAAYNAAVELWETDYLNGLLHGDLRYSFEEMFRGNTQVLSGYYNNVIIDGVTANTNDIRLIKYNGQIRIYDEEAKDYFINTVLPDLRDNGLLEGVDETDPTDAWKRDYMARSQTSTITYRDGTKSYQWTFNNLPVEILDPASEYYQKHFNNEDSPLTSNPFISSTFYNYIVGKFTPCKPDNQATFYDYLSFSASGTALEATYQLMYSNQEILSGVYMGGRIYRYKEYSNYNSFGENTISEQTINVTSDEIETYKCGGFPLKDEDGFVYDDGELQILLFDLDLVAIYNDIFGVQTETKLPIFNVCLELKLDDQADNGLVATILAESVRDSSNTTKNDFNYEQLQTGCNLFYFDVLPNMLSIGRDVEEGQIIVPDGSGAVIYFNNGKTELNYAGYNNSYYGIDKSFVPYSYSEDPAKMLLGMFGYLVEGENARGVIGAINKGGSQISLNAGTGQYNYSYFRADIRKSENVFVGTSAEPYTFVKWSKNIANNDLEFTYIILEEDELNYSKVAERYREYLIARDNIAVKGDQTDDVVVDLNFLGTFERYSLFLGVKYMTEDTLTTFDQAKNIIDELQENGVTSISTSYTGWTSNNLEYKVGSLNVASSLGESEMREFAEYCAENNIGFYPEMYVGTTKEYGYSFGNTKYSARSVVNNASVHYPYDLGQLRVDKTLNPTYYINPIYYNSIINDVTSQFEDLEVFTKNQQNNGYYLVDLGNITVGNYKKDEEVYGGMVVEYQKQALEKLSSEQELKVSAPFDYAFKYVSQVVDVPMTASMHGMFDETIPLYQMVISGLFDYSTEQINGTTNRNSNWYFTKALETGSNLSFIISAEDPSILLETDYTYYYQSYYQNWKDKIISYVNEINSLGIHKGTLTYHENVVKNVSYVEYTVSNTEKVKLYINSSNIDVNVENVGTIPAYSYIKVE